MSAARSRGLALAIGALIAVSLTGCSRDLVAPHDRPIAVHETAPGRQVSVVAGVAYYPACGNELLTHDGTVWYPFTPERPQDFPTPVARGDGGPGPGLSRDAPIVLPAVVAPGPGDDIGTLTIFDNGIAYFVTDSGDLSTWLTTEKITYTWAC